jgi:hypothetical protein
VLLPRIRQAVVVTRDLEPLLTRLRERLGAPEPYRDPGVDRFGLRNAVLAVGDSFLEVLTPDRPDTAVGRHLERRGGDAGYMVMLQVTDMDATRTRLADLGVRVVFEVKLPDAVDLHLHPHDVPGALVAVDTMDPPGSWRWGGPAHTGREVPAVGGLAGLTVAVPDPLAAARRWAAVAGLPAPSGPAVEFVDAGQRVDFIPGDPGLVRIALALPGAVPESLAIGDTTLEIRETPP